MSVETSLIHNRTLDILSQTITGVLVLVSIVTLLANFIKLAYFLVSMYMLL